MHPLPDESLLSEIEAVATKLAGGAGAILARHFGAPLDIEYKDEKKRDPVTNADKETQDYIKAGIAERFPDHGILGEEDEEDDSPAPDFLWALDPLDGTKNYLHGMPVYASSIGVLYKGVPIAGAVFVPWPRAEGGSVLHARKGGGAFDGSERIAVRKSDEPQGNAIVTLPGSFGAMYRFQKAMWDKVGEVRMTGSIAFELALTARGVTQYTVTTGGHLWDVAGGVILVTEAGGLALRGRRDGGLLKRTRWEPEETLVPWESGKTTMKELRNWRGQLMLGGPAVVEYVSANLRDRRHLRRRLLRPIRRLIHRRRSPHGRS